MNDENYYGIAAREIVERRYDSALMAKAYALALGDPDKTRAFYIGLRADRLKEEAAIQAHEAQAQARRQVAKDRAAKEQSERQRLAAEHAAAEQARQRHAAERAASEAAERKRLAAEKAARHAADQRRRREEEIEAQKAGDAWRRSEAISDGWPALDSTSAVQATKPPPPAPPPPALTPAELDQIIASLKKAHDAKPSLF
jgi:hypothetical protein